MCSTSLLYMYYIFHSIFNWEHTQYCLCIVIVCIWYVLFCIYIYSIQVSSLYLWNARNVCWVRFVSGAKKTQIYVPFMCFYASMWSTSESRRHIQIYNQTTLSQITTTTQTLCIFIYFIYCSCVLNLCAISSFTLFPVEYVYYISEYQTY